MPAPNSDDPLRTSDHAPEAKPEVPARETSEAPSAPPGKTTVTDQPKLGAEPRTALRPMPTRHPPPSPATPSRACSGAAAWVLCTRPATSPSNGRWP